MNPSERDQQQTARQELPKVNPLNIPRTKVGEMEALVKGGSESVLPNEPTTRTGEQEIKQFTTATPVLQQETEYGVGTVRGVSNIPTGIQTGIQSTQISRERISPERQYFEEEVVVRRKISPERIIPTGVQYQRERVISPIRRRISPERRYAGIRRATETLREPTLDWFNQMVTKDTHCFLGRTGFKVSRICLGTMNFGNIDKQFGDRPGQLSESDAHKILDRFVQLGGNCIDTANFFPWFGSQAGESERIIGNWLKNQRREDICVITKVRMPTNLNNINSGGLSRNNLFNSVEKSLRHLQTNYIDVLMIDGWDATVSIHETVMNLNELIKMDKIRYFGVCDLKGWQLQKLIDASRTLNLHKCVCYEGEYNLLTRGCEWEVADVCRNERIGFISYSPLKYGFLTDNYNPYSNRPVQGSRIEAASKDRPNLVAMAEPFEEMMSHPRFGRVLNTCQQIARSRNLTTSQVAILWALQKGFVTSVVIGVDNIQELEENMKILTDDLYLTRDEMLLLNESSQLTHHYPYHTHLSSLAGYKYLRPGVDAAFEQLNLLTHALSFEEHQLRRQPRETWHESKHAFLPERELHTQPTYGEHVAEPVALEQQTKLQQQQQQQQPIQHQVQHEQVQQQQQLPEQQMRHQ